MGTVTLDAPPAFGDTRDEPASATDAATNPSESPEPPSDDAAVREFDGLEPLTYLERWVRRPTTGQVTSQGWKAAWNGERVADSLALHEYGVRGTINGFRPPEYRAFSGVDPDPEAVRETLEQREGAPAVRVDVDSTGRVGRGGLSVEDVAKIGAIAITRDTADGPEELKRLSCSLGLEGDSRAWVVGPPTIVGHEAATTMTTIIVGETSRPNQVVNRFRTVALTLEEVPQVVQEFVTTHPGVVRRLQAEEAEEAGQA